MNFTICLIGVSLAVLCQEVRSSQEQASEVKQKVSKRALRPIWWINRRNIAKRNLLAGFPIKANKEGEELGETEEPEEPTVGDKLMKDFMLFLTLKDSGMLDYCLGKR